MTTELKVGLAQMAPVYLDRFATIEKVCHFVEQAANDGCGLVAFGEALVPGYPFWPERTDGAKFESRVQKAWFARYADQAVDIARGDLERVCSVARQHNIAVYLGCIETTPERGHSLYASLVYVDSNGKIGSVHRKLCPTYEERLVWSAGDGHGLVVHDLDGFRVGGLNCWENWMPLARSSLYAQGEDLHVAVWPGSIRNTEDITRFMAREGRSYVLSVSGLMHRDDLARGSASDLPDFQRVADTQQEWLADGGSCIAGPDGNWIVEPVVKKEALVTATLDFARVLEERQNFDPAGHYSRPDVTRLKVDRRRQQGAVFGDIPDTTE